MNDQDIANFANILFQGLRARAVLREVEEERKIRMFMINQGSFHRAQLLARLQTRFGALDAGNGTSAADALAAALIIDQREAGAPDGDLSTLTNDQLQTALVDLVFALQKDRDTAIDLPFGTAATGSKLDGLKIAGRSYVLDAGRPGLHEVETVRRDAHGPNLDRLRKLIARKTAKLACRRLGIPHAAFIAEADARYLLQFEPFAAAGGVVLQRGAWEIEAPRFCSALPDQLDTLAASIVDDMRVLWKRRTEIGRRVTQVRNAAEAYAASARKERCDIFVHAITIDLSMQRDDDKLSLYIEYRGLDEALREGKVLDYVPWDDEKSCLSPPRSMYFRDDDAKQLRLLGANGRIDEMAAAICAAAPEGQASVLARLAGEYETYVGLPTPSGLLHAMLFWRDGVIKADLSMPKGLDWCGKWLKLHGVQLPETVLMSLTGRPLSDFASLPFACKAPIVKVENCGGEFLRLTLDLGKQYVNCATGTIWS